ncbi:MAG: hypothetical protein IPN29_11580 [Saprospiraceae bacterium]|nr:hypothetical protein [Saprospiraceae bacterium]
MKTIKIVPIKNVKTGIFLVIIKEYPFVCAQGKSIHDAAQKAVTNLSVYLNHFSDNQYDYDEILEYSAM